MRGPLAVNAEVVSSRNDTPTEDLEPDAIDHHACCEGILGARDDLSNFTPPTSKRFESLRCSGHELEKTPRNHLARVFSIACWQNGEIVAWLQIGQSIESSGRSKTRFRAAVFLNKFVQSRTVVILIGDQMIFQQPGDPASVIIASLSLGPTA